MKNNQYASNLHDIVRDRHFLQLLEGARSVRHVYEKIKSDERHAGCEIVAEAESKARLFPRWYMGKVEGKDLNDGLPGLGSLLVKGECSANSEMILDLIKKFSASQSSIEI